MRFFKYSSIILLVLICVGFGLSNGDPSAQFDSLAQSLKDNPSQQISLDDAKMGGFLEHLNGDGDSAATLQGLNDKDFFRGAREKPELFAEDGPLFKEYTRRIEQNIYYLNDGDNSALRKKWLSTQGIEDLSLDSNSVRFREFKDGKLTLRDGSTHIFTTPKEVTLDLSEVTPDTGIKIFEGGEFSVMGGARFSEGSFNFKQEGTSLVVGGSGIKGELGSFDLTDGTSFRIQPTDLAEFTRDGESVLAIKPRTGKSNAVLEISSAGQYQIKDAQFQVFRDSDGRAFGGFNTGDKTAIYRPGGSVDGDLNGFTDGFIVSTGSTRDYKVRAVGDVSGASWDIGGSVKARPSFDMSGVTSGEFGINSGGKNLGGIRAGGTINGEQKVMGALFRRSGDAQVGSFENLWVVGQDGVQTQYAPKAASLFGDAARPKDEPTRSAWNPLNWISKDAIVKTNPATGEEISRTYLSALPREKSGAVASPVASPAQQTTPQVQQAATRANAVAEQRRASANVDQVLAEIASKRASERASDSSADVSSSLSSLKAFIIAMGPLAQQRACAKITTKSEDCTHAGCAWDANKSPKCNRASS